jgi:curved DNA-binding protein CbpA
MTLLNEAYRVLSDPDLRREHDTWIARQEEALTAAHQRNSAKGKVNREQRHGGPNEAGKKEDFLKRSNAKTRFTELDHEYEIFKRKLPYYLITGAALAALFLVFWASR